jgi:hypothetical protein
MVPTRFPHNTETIRFRYSVPAKAARMAKQRFTRKQTLGFES